MTTPADAFVALVRAAFPSDPSDPAHREVFDSGIFPNPKNLPTRYVVVWTTPGERDAPALCPTYDYALHRAAVISIVTGSGPDLGRQVRWMDERIRDHLLGASLIADGWSCGVIDHDYSNTTERDEDVLERPAVSISSGYRFAANRIA